MNKTSNTTSSARTQDSAYLEADILSNLRLAADFADLAEGHASIFDDNGFKYCVDQFLTHARLCSEKLKKLRSLSS